MKYLIILLGGGIGAVSRFALSRWTQNIVGIAFPIGTLIVNLTGCLIIGFMAGAFERFVVPSNLRLFIFVGILGGYTTFSSFGLETMNLLKEAEFRMALLNMLLSNVLGIILVFAGYWLAGYIFKFGK